MDSIALSSPLEFRTAFNAFGGYCIPVAALHRPAAQTLMAGEVWEPETLALVAEVGRQMDVVHAGAFFGDFLPALSRAASTVWAFEPCRENFRCAHMTGLLNGLSNVRLHHGGLSDYQGELSLRTREPGGEVLGGASRFVDGNPSGLEERELSPVATLDSLLPADRPIAVIQLDVEGHEQRALTGALVTVRRWRPVLVLETLPEARWIAAHLAPLGYRQTAVVHDNAVLAVSPD